MTEIWCGMGGMPATHTTDRMWYEHKQMSVLAKMPHCCPFCVTEFGQRCIMIRHQRTAGYCLDIQKEQGVATQEEKHECECGASFSRKSALKRHKTTCGTPPGSTSTTYNIENQTTVNQLNQHVFKVQSEAQ